ncbi:MAG: hypothetical protein QM679_12385 [Patulibacter sp.]
MIPRSTPARAATMLAAATLAAVPVTAVAATKRSVNASGTVKYHHREAKAKIVEQHGTVKGQPFGTGALVLRSKLAARKKLSYSIRLTTKSGAVWGNGTADLTVTGTKASYKGTLRILGGNGSYKKISHSVLNVSGSGPANLRDDTTVRITGSVTY